MDHHCLFLYTCIAYKNYKFFFLTLFYACFILLLMSFTLIDSLRFYINEFGDNLILTIYSITYFFTIGLTILLCYFFYLHISLLCKNLTTIDYIEKGYLDSISGPPNIYSLGTLKNIKDVLGSFLLFLIPVGK
jgi:hypothetical protein